MATVKKGVLTQGTQVWIEHGDSAAPTLAKMDCIKSLNLGDDSTSDIDDTCLEETDTKTSQPGLNTPGDGEVLINTDPLNESHMKLLQLADSHAKVKVYVGWADGTAAPTLEATAVTLPTTRTFSSFEAILRATSPTFEPDSLVQHKVALKRQSKVTTIYKLPA